MNAGEIISLIFQLVSGVVGANLASNFLDQFDLGFLGNSIAGIVGAGLGGKLLALLLGGSGSHAGTKGGGLLALLLGHSVATSTRAHSGNFDLSSFLALVVGGGVGGAIVMLIVGLGRQSLSD